MPCRPLPLLFLFVVAMTARGQSLTTPFYSAEGVATAQARARAEFAADAELIFIGSLGDFTIPANGTIPIDLHLGFYLDTVMGSGFSPSQYPGQADAWIYLFRSADSGSTFPLIVVKILGTYQAQSFQGFPFPPQLGSGSLPTDRPFSGSGAMMARLKEENGTFRQYHDALPGSKPDFITYGELINDSTRIPVDFLNGPAWTLTFLGGGDTSMTCFVSATTGTTFCQNFSIPSEIAPSPATRSDGGSITIFPNPSTGHVRILISAKSRREKRVDRLLLANERGEVVRDLTALITPARIVDLGTDALPRGLYFILCIGPGWQAVSGLLVKDER